MELARGQVTDRPWGMTLWALEVRQLTGQLTLRAEGKRYCIAFDHGAVVAATSPLASDSAVRVALIHHLIAPAQAADITRRIAAGPGRDEVELLAELAGLTLDQTMRLRRWVIEQRAARTFSIDEGELVVDSTIDIPVLSGFAIDVRSVIYLGARMNLSEQRLGDELRRVGPKLKLEPGAEAEVPHFGFGEAELPILEALQAGTSLAELEARHRDLDPRHAQAVIYALVCCSLCTGIMPPALLSSASEAAAANDFSIAMKRGQGAPPSDVYSRTRTGRDVVLPRAPAGQRPPAPGSPPPTSSARSARPSDGASRPQVLRAPSSGPDEPGVARSGRASTRPAVPRTQTSRGTTPAAGTTAVSRTPSSGVPAVGRTTSPGSSPNTTRAPTGSPNAGRVATGSSLPAGRVATGTSPAAARAPTGSSPNAGRAPTGRMFAAGRAPTGGTPTLGGTPTPGRTPTPAGLPPTPGRSPTPAGLPPMRASGTHAIVSPGPRTSSRMAAVGPPAEDPDPSPSPPGLDPLAAARDVFKRGQSRLRVENLEEAIADFTRAVELAPGEVDFAATLAWARFCHTRDKQALAQTTREALTRAIRKSPTPEVARFYLGRVERMLGRDREALRHFQQVLETQPKHRDAAAEIRVIEARMAQAAAKESGVFGRKR